MTNEYNSQDRYENDDRSHILCPVCGEPVINNPAENLYTIEFIESDFRTRTYQDDMLDSWLVFCPTCFYITHDFLYVPEKLENVRAYVLSDKYKNLFNDNFPTTMDMFFIYESILGVSEPPAYMFADTYLRISWLFDDNKDRENADRYREMAVSKFAKALLNKKPNAKNRSLIYYYIAELSRRNGNFIRARKSLLKMDTSLRMFKYLFQFQSKLINSKNESAVTMPWKEVPHDDQLS